MNGKQTNNEMEETKMEKGNIVKVKTTGVYGIVNKVDDDVVYVIIKGDRFPYNPSDLEFITDALPEYMAKVEEIKIPSDTTQVVSKLTAELLDEYGYSHNSLDIVMNEWALSNGKLYAMLRNHPNWSEKDVAIVIPGQKFTKPVERKLIHEAVEDFFRPQLVKWMNTHQETENGFTYAEIRKAIENLNRVVDTFYTAEDIPGLSVKYLGCSRRDEVRKTLRNWNNKAWRLENKGTRKGDRVISSENYYIALSYEQLLSMLSSWKSEYAENGLITDEFLTELKDNIPNGGKFPIPIVGQKIGKYLQKVHKFMGFDKVVKMITQEWDTESNDGTVTHHTREKDMGYNYYRALLGDAITPQTYTDDMYISINMVDYLTMSFGYKWASCHTIDKENTRNIEDHVYEGCYSSGTVSYALDDVSIVVYTIKRDGDFKRYGIEADPNCPPCRATKMKRCMFHLGNDKICQSRLYPDGRDGGDDSIYGQFRAIVQKTIAECLGVANMWTKKNDTSLFYKGDGATFYPDYDNCSECNTSYLNILDGLKNLKEVEIGVRPTCFECGNENYEETTILCEDCYNGQRCNLCGDRVDFDYEGVTVPDGSIYCCEECARRDGWIYVERIDNYAHEDEVEYCNYCNEYFVRTGEEVYTEDGHMYCDSECAMNAGYIFADDIESWVEIENTYSTETGFVYSNLDRAEEDGYVLVDGELVKSEEVA